ncbi:protein of unknown function [Clostridium beijerinckii]|nr:protein of unknown function [Clostridium beijerinckii]
MNFVFTKGLEIQGGLSYAKEDRYKKNRRMYKRNYCCFRR